METEKGNIKMGNRNKVGKKENGKLGNLPVPCNGIIIQWRLWSIIGQTLHVSSELRQRALVTGVSRQIN